MKHRIAVVLAGVVALGCLSAAPAFANATVTVPGLGSGNVDSGGITLDGASSNPNRLAGYVIIHSDGSVSCGSAGGPYNDDGSENTYDPVTNPNGFQDPGTCNPS